MEPVTQASQKLIDYGIVGVILFISLVVLYFLFRYIKEQITQRFIEKDKMIEFLQNSVQEDKTAMQELVAQYASQQAKVITIMETQVENSKDFRNEMLKKIDHVPEEVVDKMLIAYPKKLN